MRMWNWLKRFRRRKVALVMHDGQLVFAKAYFTQSGWTARWINNPNQWSILKPDGTCEGTNLVERWHKISGWEEDEGSIATNQ